MIRGALTAVLLILCGTANAAAEVGYPISTVQAKAANAEWLAYTPPPVAPGVVCLLDSGVDPNPDTEQVVVGNHALYPETGTGDEVARLAPAVQPGGHPDGHGTLMAMMMAAPINGWGMVGIAPSSVQVYNMKALQAGSTRFADEKEAEAIEACSQLKRGAYPTLSVINLSLSSETSPEPAVAEEIDNEIIAAQNLGISVVAAAGNNAGQLQFPASYPGVLAVGAEDAANPGALCSFSARGEGLGLLAPGCDTLTGGLQGAFQDTGEPDHSMGTSQASSLVSAALASIRAYAPTLTRNQAEHCLTSTVHKDAIDVSAAYQACGLQNIVKAGTAGEPTLNDPASPITASKTISNSTGGPNACGVSTSCSSAGTGFGEEVRSTGQQHACPTPRLLGVARSRRQRLTIVVRPVRGCSLQARTLTHNKRWTQAKHRANQASLSLDSPRGELVEIRFTGTTHEQTPSRWITIKPR